MKLKHLKTILHPQPNEARINAIDWSPNSKKLAVCSSDRVIMLYDENGERKDRFATKSGDSKYGKKSYVVRAIAFSPDSSKLAVGQSDNIIYVYKLGEKWEEKKAICNKFLQPSPVTSLIWPVNQPIVLGLLDGKVRVANIKTNKSHTVYNSEKHTVCLASNFNGKGFISGHIDGSIIRYFFDDEGSNDSQGKVTTHPSTPYALAWGANNNIIAAGSDKRIYIYGRDGRVLQQFDFSRDFDEKEFTVASSSPSGQSVVIGSYDKLRIFNWSSRKGVWDEGETKEILNLYSVSGLSWKKDGSKLCVSTICGGVELFDCCLKKILYKDKFELNYVGPNQVIVNNVKTNVNFIIKSYSGHEINEVKITGKDKFIVAHTSETLILGDMISNKLSEIPWYATGGNEKFSFDNENVCVIHRAGELSIVEYGSNEILGCVRTEFINSHYISIRINERKQLTKAKNKKIAYLIDLKTISVLDLCSGLQIIQISNDSKIDWIELNETASHILFRDKKLRLYMSNLETGNKVNLVNYCSYVQWVPGSDVIVAQSRESLCIWYNIKCVDRVTTYALNGDIQNIVRNDGKTEVLVNDGIHQVSYSLDEGLIEFQTALEDGDFARAVMFLESIELSEETESMWRNLADKALLAGVEYINIAERCYAALGDICKTHYLRKTIDFFEENTNNIHFEAKTRLALLAKKFKTSENIYLENGKIEEAIAMYKSMFMWEEAIEVASVKNHPSESSLRVSYFEWLLSTNQHEKAGEIKENTGDYSDAISLYLKSGVPARAARLVLSRRDLISNSDFINRICQALLKFEFHEKAGELYEAIGNHNEALKCYRKGNAFQRAIELARHFFPGDVLRLEEDWGNYLISIHQLDNAIQHFIESGSYVKALEAAVNSNQWQKVATILENQNNTDKDYVKYYQKVAEHFLSNKKLDKAEEFFIKGKCYRQLVESYINLGLWEKAHNIGTAYLDKSELTKMYENQAHQLEIEGKLKEAENMYLTIQRPEEAINMYKKNKMQKEVIRLINKYSPEVLDPTLIKLAEEAEKEGNLRQSEQYYLQMGDWKSAINLYRKKNMWEDAYRVSQTTSDLDASKQVAYLWAKHLGGESAVKLLNKLGLLDKAIEYACDHNAFDFAFELSKSLNDEKLPDIFGKYAMYLEDEGRFVEAEASFIKANKPREAVLMWVHQQDWDAAQRVAEKYDPDSVSDVLVGQARFAFNAHDYRKAESYLIRAQRPELAVKLYREAEMWEEAIRVCKEYVPHKLENLQEDYDREMSIHYKKNEKFNTSRYSDSTGILQNLLDQGRQWENNKEYLRSVECYLKISFDSIENPSNTDIQIMEKAWIRAGEVSLKHLTNDQSSKVIEIIGQRLIKIKKFSLASDFYKAIDKIKEALNSLIEGEEWDKAKQVAREINPKYENYVEEKYKKFLKSSGKAAELENLDLIEALNIYAEQNNWDKCLSMAQDTNPQVMQKYLAMYATQLIKANQSSYALQLYIKYGSPYFEQNFNIYKRIFKDIVSMRDLNNGNSYHIWAKLRDFVFQIYEDSTKTISGGDASFEKMLLVSHFYAIRSAMMMPNHNLNELIYQVSISLLRYTDIIPADKAFYEAGIFCRDNNNLNLAFILFNRYLDLAEAIDDSEGSSDMLDNTDFEGTDVPLEVPLPDKRYTNSQEHNEVKEWVLSISMDQKLEHQLPKDERNVFVASLYNKFKNEMSPPCMITGFPVIKNGVQFKLNNRTCISENLNKFQMANKISRCHECTDVLKFIVTWCGSLPNSVYSFDN